ncbi:MAG: NAD-dependent epimerase/dehydratase family protein [Pirellulales bacterium]|nr:NAD-dependent epimerase/dehydratase family protein [Pirellulales bacterium]
MQQSTVNAELLDAPLPDTIDSVAALEDLLSRPTAGVIDVFSRREGDLIVLGAGGKMGPSLARMARRATDAAGSPRKIFAVSRSFSPQIRASMEERRIEIREGDLLEPDFIDSLPDAPNVIYMAGRKFGSSGDQPLTWALNAYLPALVCRRFSASRLVAFSTGNVYGMASVESGGSRESDPPQPRGEYAMSCLGRERMFEYFGKKLAIPVALIRLNYAVEMRYGVLVDLAQMVYRGQEIDLTMGYVNVIWQGDASAAALCALDAAACPARLLNVAGPVLLRVRDVCERFGRLFGKSPRFIGAESPEALLNDGAQAHRLYGLPRVSADRMIRWIAPWIASGESVLGKPTHYEVRDGVY